MNQIKHFGLLAFLLFSGWSSAQTATDQALAKDYAKIEETLAAMGGEMEDDDRLKRMEDFQAECRSFIDRYRSEVGKVKQGHFDLGRVYLHLAQPGDALSSFEQYIALYPQGAQAEECRLLIADSQRSLNRLGDAAESFTDFIARYPKSERIPFARLGLATCHLLELRFSEAINELEGLISAHADHNVAVDAELQLVEALVNAGRFAEARERVDRMLGRFPDAQELKRHKEVLELLGSEAPDLVDTAKWIGTPGSQVSRLRGNVVVLCFFVNWSIPSTRELQFLSDLQNRLRGSGAHIFGVTKTYKTKAGWDVAKEGSWLNRYRENPRYVVEKELGARGQDGKDLANEVFEALEKKIELSFALNTSFDSHRAYKVRGVPWVVVIDKSGKVQVAKEGGSQDGGFQRRLIERRVRALLTD